MQRHHLLPRQVMRARCFRAMFDKLGQQQLLFNDFRANGLLLPATTACALSTGLPLHRGPHPRYNEVVYERVAQIERGFAKRVAGNVGPARDEALMRLRLLQSALRRQLLQREDRRMVLNRKDPFRAGIDFAELDRMADLLWSGSEG